MSFVINTNVMSLVARQNLNESQQVLNQAIGRLSSGKRINSAADDAAGQAIANRMTAQIQGLTQAKRNANDGISLAQTTEGALDQINDNLQRIRELTVQAWNGTNSGSDLTSIQDEIDQRLAEINRVSAQTSFNGVDVLAKDQALQIQVGANDGQTITINLAEINAQTLNLDTYDVAANPLVASADFGATVSNGDTGVSVKFSIADLTTAGTTILESGAGGTSSALTDIYALKDGSGYVALADDGKYYALVTSDATALTYDSTASATDASLVDTSSPVDAIQAGVATLDTNTSLGSADIVELNDAQGKGTGTYVIDNGDGTYNMVDITTAGAATAGEAVTVDPLASLDAALSQVDGLRSTLGAIQNRFDSAISNLATSTINLKSARSRIIDADYAAAVSQMSKGQILQQAGTAVLAQANQSSQTVLSLLR